MGENLQGIACSTTSKNSHLKESDFQHQFLLVDVPSFTCDHVETNMKILRCKFQMLDTEGVVIAERKWEITSNQSQDYLWCDVGGFRKTKRDKRKIKECLSLGSQFFNAKEVLDSTPADPAQAAISTAVLVGDQISEDTETLPMAVAVDDDSASVPIAEAVIISD
jgi:hypothetical protein